MRLRTINLLTRSALLGALGLGVLAQPAASQGVQKGSGATQPVAAVLELFTSQGCSSCPAADALLVKYAGRSDVIALSMPVDYWDYLGWKDTLANPKFSARQKHYARERGDGQVYTPQMVVNGLTHAIGSSEAAIDQAIATTAKEVAPSHVPVKIHMDGARMVIEAGDAPAGSTMREATVWLALVHKESVIKVERGENTGKMLRYVNVVRELNPVGMWSGKGETLTISRAAITEPGNEMCVVLLQVGKGGPIIGAAINKSL